MSNQFVVIGAGFGGLAAAIRLAARGHRVTLIERRDKVGGRAYVYQDQGFTFDGGPTVITAPWLIDELFELAGRKRDAYVDFVPVDPFYRIFFDDGAQFDYSGDAAAMADRIAAFSPHPGDLEGYRQFLLQTERIFDKGFTELATTPFHSPWQMLKVAPDLVRLQSYRTVYDLVARYVRDERLRQVLSFHPLLVGGNPFQTTSIYALIHHLERTWGVWYAMGGTGAITAALEKLFLELGGTLLLGTDVAEILTSGRRATGVRLADGTEITADAVVCNAEVAAAYQRLVPARLRRKYTDRRLANMRYSMSLVVIYFGTDRRYRDPGASPLAHHNIVLGPRYRELLADIFDRKVLADDFSLYLHMPTLTDPSLAPPGGETFYVLAPVPHLGGGVDWETRARPYRDAIISALERRFLPDLSRHIVTERMIDPRHFRDDLSSYLGSAFSVEPILTQSAWFRPHNRSEELDRLYFVGAGTHPGAGLPGVLSSATIVDTLIARDFGHEEAT
ncbi:MAG: phytoene desaturase [Thermomicrobiales bacterium]|nr:phytoene desaturase [Thermomicrobiales bacterium]